MNDIKRRPKLFDINKNQEEGHFIVPEKKSSIKPSVKIKVEKAISKLSDIGNKIIAIGNKPDYLIIEHSKNTLPAKLERHSELVKPIKIPKENKTVDKIKTKLNKTSRKVIIANTIAILLLTTYVVTDNKKYSATDISTVDSKNTTSLLRNYLPGSQKIDNILPLDEKAEAANTDKEFSAWLTPWNIDSIKNNNKQYKSISVFWLTVIDDKLTLSPKASFDNWLEYKQKYSLSDQTFYLSVSGDPNFTYIALSDPEKQRAHIANLLENVNKYGFDGIDIDYEALGSENKDLFTNFINNLTTAFHADNKKVAVTVEARIANQFPMDWPQLNKITDEMRIMAYDYHGRNTGTPGPIAPLGWIKEILDYCQNNLNTKKIILGLGNYGYDWHADQNSWTGSGLSFEQSTKLATDKSTPIIRSTGIDERGYDIGSIPNFTYIDEQQINHQVWFEDSVSLNEKINLAKQYNIKGIIFWSLGLGDNLTQN